MRDSIWKHVGAALVLAVIFYAAFFYWMGQRRAEKGPWEVTFQTDASGRPSLQITERKLNLSEKVSFSGKTIRPGNLRKKVSFNDPVSDLPFGKMLFQDSTFLPGTVTMEICGHKIELVRRVLRIDTREYPWNEKTAIDLP